MKSKNKRNSRNVPNVKRDVKPRRMKWVVLQRNQTKETFDLDSRLNPVHQWRNRKRQRIRRMYSTVPKQMTLFLVVGRVVVVRVFVIIVISARIPCRSFTPRFHRHSWLNPTRVRPRYSSHLIQRRSRRRHLRVEWKTNKLYGYRARWRHCFPRFPRETVFVTREI